MSTTKRKSKQPQSNYMYLNSVSQMSILCLHILVSILHGGPIQLFLVPNAVVCVILSVGVAHVAVALFIFRFMSGPLPYV